MSVPDEGYSRNKLCVIISISMFLFTLYMGVLYIKISSLSVNDVLLSEK